MRVDPIKKSKLKSSDWSVIETLEEVIREIKSGEADYNACFLSLVRIGDEEFETSWRASNLLHYQAVALLEYSKNEVINRE